VNIALIGYFYFNLIRVYDESSWKIASQMSVPKMGLVQLYIRMNLIQNNIPHLISEQLCTDNFIPRTNQHSTNNIDCAESEEIKFDQILIDPEN
jgi:hypothetical protein